MRRWLAILAQMELVGAAIAMSFWGGLPWLAPAALGLLGVSTLASQIEPAGRWGGIWRWTSAVALAGTLSIPASLVLMTDAGFTFEGYLDHFFAVFAWLAATAILAAGRTGSGGSQLRAEVTARWKSRAMMVALFSGASWIAVSYLHNVPRAFFTALLTSMVLGILCRLWFHLTGFGVQVVNTCLLLAVALPLADRCLHTGRSVHYEQVRNWKEFYSYADANGDPARFAIWSRYFDGQWNRLKSELGERDPAGVLPFRLRPGTAEFFQSRIRINNHGFRGGDIAEERGDAYRIVALGESTTFGMTLKSEDRPWPELLEALIRERLKPERPVQVINAGLPMFTIENNLALLVSDILPLKPDMIISYHGANGFFLFDSALPPPVGGPPPLYYQRPLRLLAEAEFGLKSFVRTQRHLWKLRQTPVAVGNPLATSYGRAYETLIQICRTNRIKLALASYSMAVNRKSEPRVIEFYRSNYRAIHAQIQANEAHSRLLEQLAARSPEICFVDTHSLLDGHHEKFIDALHFTQEGRQQMAENVFGGTRKALVRDLEGRDLED